MSKKKIMIIAHFCDYGNEQSNNRFNYLARLFAAAGHEVELVTSSFSHREKKQRSPAAENGEPFKTTLIDEPSYKRNVSVKRLFYSHYRFAKNLEAYLKGCGRPDLVYCAIPSVNAAEAAGRFAAANGIPFVIDVQDLWPEAYRLVLRPHAVYQLLTAPMRRRVNRVYAAADAVFAVSDTYARRALEANRKCKEGHTVFLGTDLAAFDQAVAAARPQNGQALPEDCVKIAYCGTLGHSYNLNIVFDALAALERDGVRNYRFLVLGSGPLQESFQQRAQRDHLQVEFYGKLPYRQMCGILSGCDIAVNPLAKGSACSIINKHADYAAAGLPVVSTQECLEYRDLLESYQCGIHCEADSAPQVAAAIRRLMEDPALRTAMGKNARTMAEERFDRGRTYQEIVAFCGNM